MLKTNTVLLTLALTFLSQGYATLVENSKQLQLENQTLNTQIFPDGFLFGVASSAYQIEGAWNEDGKGVSIWDTFAHSHLKNIADGSDGNVARDSYHKHKEDVALLKELGVDFYRFSISWTRILPSGFPNQINQAGVGYYNKLIDELLANGITPMVTIYHWDLPQTLQDLGGILNPLFINWFKEYCRVVFKLFGDRVKMWTTINEPRLICNFGHGTGAIAPGVQSSGISDYICAHNVIKAHAKAYHLYQDDFKPTQNGFVGIAIDCQWYEPASNSKEDVEAAERQLQFECGLYGHPIFSNQGDYPKVVKEFIANRSKAEGFSDSRLPKFTSEEIHSIKGTYDFIALNHYTSFIAANALPSPIDDPSFEKDCMVKISQNLTWPISAFPMFTTVPWGFRKVLKWFKEQYDNPIIYVTENGFPDYNSIHDEARVSYIVSYLSSLLDAIYADGVRIKGYTVWSLLDLFEWTNGYKFGFGLFDVNSTDPSRPTTPRDSAKVYAEIIKNRQLSLNTKT